MIKSLIAFLLILAFSTASASAGAELSLSFNRVLVVDLVQAVYGDILKKNYAIAPQVVARNDEVTFQFQGADHGQVAAYMVDLLESIGIEVEQKPGHLLIKPKSGDSDRELFFYRPKHRTATYLVDFVSNLFDSGRFNSQPGRAFGARSDPSKGSGMLASDAGKAQERASGRGFGGSNSGASSPSDKPLMGSGEHEPDAFVFEGSQKEIDRLQKLLVLVDTPAGEVLIKAIVYEVGSTQKDGSAAGLALNILSGRFGFRIGNMSGLGDSVSLKSASIEAIYSALSSDSRFKVVSSPSLRVKSGANGLISVGADVPVLGSITQDKNGNPVQSVQYKASGVILDLTPTVTENGVDLFVKQQISSFVSTATGVNSTPTLIKREISTKVGTSLDEIIILGGLDEKKTNNDRSGLSFIPSWLHSASEEGSKSEILLVLQVQKI